jgi:alanine dehydrogenase
VAPEDEYVVYRAVPDSPVWDAHHHDRMYRRPPQGPQLVYLEDVVRHRAAVRTAQEQIMFSERGNIQGAQFHAVAGLVYELALRPASVTSFRPSGSCRASATYCRAGTKM